MSALVYQNCPVKTQVGGGFITESICMNPETKVVMMNGGEWKAENKVTKARIHSDLGANVPSLDGLRSVKVNQRQLFQGQF